MLHDTARFQTKQNKTKNKNLFLLNDLRLLDPIPMDLCHSPVAIKSTVKPLASDHPKFQPRWSLKRGGRFREVPFVVI